jgi:hypothetical protein
MLLDGLSLPSQPIYTQRRDNHVEKCIDLEILKIQYKKRCDILAYFPPENLSGRVLDLVLSGLSDLLGDSALFD